MIHSWLVSTTTDPDPDREGGRPRRFDNALLVDDEIVSHFIDQAYLDPDDDRVLDELLDREIGSGLHLRDLVDREALRIRLREQLRSRQDESPAAIPVTPQRRRRSARKRLTERTNSVVARILTDLGTARGGREVARAGLVSGRSANLQAVTKLLHHEINNSLGIGSNSRNELTADQTSDALDRLDELGDLVRDRIRIALGED